MSGFSLQSLDVVILRTRTARALQDEATTVDAMYALGLKLHASFLFWALDNQLLSSFVGLQLPTLKSMVHITRATLVGKLHLKLEPICAMAPLPQYVDDKRTSKRS